MKKSLIAFLLCVLMMIQSGFVLPANAGEAEKELKILAIGNSFSVDGMQYLWDIAADGGVKAVLGNLYIGGCSLDTHAKNIAGNLSAYTYYKNTSGTWNATESTSVAAALADEKWDVITVQQASPSSGMPATYEKLDEILTYLSQAAPQATVYFHMTWAYQSDSTHSGFANYGGSQMTMYNAILSAANEKILSEPRIAGVIPSGTAIQNLRTSYIGDTLTRDGYHLSYGAGRYTAALTWYAYFTGRDIREIDFAPAAYADTVNRHRAAIVEAVEGAIAHPYEITPVGAKDPGALSDAEIFERLGLHIAAYKTLDWVNTVHAYYNSASSMNLISAANSTASNLVNFIASQIYTKETLPCKSVLILDEGYRYRPEGWADENAVNTSAARPKLTTERVAVVDEAFWDGYAFRAFNLSTSPAKEVTAADAAHFRIYVPRNPEITLTADADANGDGALTVLDALITLKTVFDGKGPASDMNGDGLAAIADVLVLFQRISA